MKNLLTIILITFSFNIYALGGYDSLADVEKSLLTDIVNNLDINADNKFKYKLYKAHSFAFEGVWGSKAFRLNELAASKLKDGQEKGVYEVAFNHKDQGTVFLTYIYKPEVKQIIVLSKQVRYGDKSFILGLFEDRKMESEKYRVAHESDNYGLLQEKGKVSYEFFHVGATAASLVYSTQAVIDL
jgi:hypothetical protein